jgi:hypothetical protein
MNPIVINLPPEGSVVQKVTVDLVLTPHKVSILILLREYVHGPDHRNKRELATLLINQIKVIITQIKIIDGRLEWMWNL